MYLKVKDFSVSGESFNLIQNDKKDLLYTDPQPSQENLKSYYESDDYISHTDSKRSLFEKLYQAVRKISLQKKLNLIAKYQPQKGRLLDIGAGTGEFLKLANSNGWQSIGIEPSEKARKIAISKGVSFEESMWQIENNSVDVITMWHVLEHVPDYKSQFAELKRMLKTSGTILIAVPNYKSYDAKIYGEYWAAFDVPRHLWHFSKEAIKRIAIEYNFELVKVLPMKFDSFYVSLLSEKYKHGKMRYLPALLNGLRSNWYGKQNNEYSSHIYVLKNPKI